MGKYLDDILILIGSVLLLIGTYIVMPVATWFVGGVMLITAGILIGAAKQERTEKK